MYSFEAEYLGDWYDVDAVIQALNHALEEAQRPERFFLLYTGDQTCIVTFAPEAAFLQVAELLYIPLEQYARSAVHRGSGYEHYVKQRMQDETGERSCD